MEGDLEIAHTDLEEVTNMDTLPEVVGMLPEEEEGKAREPGVGRDSRPSMMGSVVGVERHSVYPYHCGSVHTHCSDQLPLPKKVCCWAV